MTLLRFAAAATLLAMIAHPAIAGDQKAAKTYIVVNEAVGVPVFPDDITDRPYEVLGEVRAGVRKATLFSKKASEEKIYRELWERGEKMGADAVIKADYGNSHITAFSWGKTNATGIAIKFKPVEAVAPVAVEQPAPAADAAEIPPAE